MLAGIAKTPELALDKAESDAIADASVKVAAMYDLTADPKIVAWSNLAMTLGMVYGSRFIAINARKKTAKETRREKVVPINGGAFGVPEVKLPGWDTSPLGPDGKPTKP